MRLSGKVAIVTGGGSGIGRATVRRLAVEGAAVLIADLNPTSGEALANDLQAIPGVVPDPLNVPVGCRFHNRCTSFMPGICDRREPALRDVEGGHLVRCYLYEDEHGGVHPNAERRSAS